MFNKIYQIKSRLYGAYCRAVRGYDYRIRNGYGLEYYFEQIIPEIKIFCERELKEQKEYEVYGDDNPRTEIFETTLKLIADWEKMTDIEELQNENQLNKLFEYISKNLGYYWN